MKESEKVAWILAVLDAVGEIKVGESKTIKCPKCGHEMNVARNPTHHLHLIYAECENCKIAFHSF